MSKQLAVVVLLFVFVAALSWPTLAQRDCPSSCSRCVDALTGMDHPGCLNGSTPCRHLSYALLRDPANDSSVCLLASNASHPHNSSQVLSSASNVTISSYPPGSVATVACQGNSGFAFVGVTAIRISSVRFINCQAERNSTTYYNTTPTTQAEKFLVGLYFWRCRNVILSEVHVSDSEGVGAVFFECNGENFIQSSRFAQNRWKKKSPLYRGGGGGVIVEFPYCPPGQVYWLCVTMNLTNNYNTNASYLFNDTDFEENYSYLHNPSQYAFTTPGKRSHIVFGRGGGLTLYFRGQAHNNSVHVLNSSFVRNKALYGGGALTEIQDDATKNKVFVESCNFTANEAVYTSQDWGTAGGAIRFGVTSVLDRVSGILSNKLSVWGSRFSQNKAYLGGGLSLIVTSTNSLNSSAGVSIEANHWSHNVARLGAAVDITTWGTAYEGNVPVVLQNNTFSNNNVSYWDSRSLILGSGTVYIDAVSVSFRGDNYFLSNSGTALVIHSAAVSFDLSSYAKNSPSSTTFCGNKGRSGGAIALYGDAWITVFKNYHFSFEKNIATFLGGAIFAEAIGNRNLISTRQCFIQYESFEKKLEASWNITFTFTDNMAGFGCSIYATSLIPCIWQSAAGPGSYTTEDLQGVFKNGTVFHYERSPEANCTTGDVASAPSHAMLDTVDSVNVTDALNEKYPVYMIYSGAAFPLPFLVKDDLGRSIEGQSFYVTSSNSIAVTVSNQFAVSSTDFVKLEGCPGATATLSFISSQEPLLSIKIDVKVAQCPPGFQKTNTKCVCRCSNVHIPMVHSCRASNMTASIHLGYWYGCFSNGSTPNRSLAEYNGSFAYAPCGLGFCNANILGQYLPLVNGTSENITCRTLNQVVCNHTGQHRTGVMCSHCESGYGISLTSWDYKCVRCTVTTKAGAFFLLFAAEILPLLVFVLVFIVFDLDILSGPLYSFVFICQVKYSILTQHSTLMDTSFTGLMKFDRFISGIFNLRFFGLFVDPPNTCISDDLNVLDLLMIRYAIVSIPFITLGLFLVVGKCYASGWCCPWGAMRDLVGQAKRHIAKLRLYQNPHSTILRGLCSFFVLASSDLMKISAEILTPAYIMSAEDSNTTHPIAPRVQVQGDVVAFSHQHWPYALVAMTVLLVGVALPCFFLLTRPCVPRLLAFCKIERKRPFSWVVSFYSSNRLKPFFDCFQGCFRKNREFFAGLFIFYRVAFYIPLMTPKHPNDLLLANLIIIFGIFCIHSVCQPYREDKGIVNGIDSIMFMSIGLLEALNYYNYVAHSDLVPQQSDDSSLWLQVLVQFFPYAVVLCLLGYYIALSQKMRNCLPFLKGKKVLNLQRRPTEEPLTESFEGSYGTFDRRPSDASWSNTSVQPKTPRD